MTTTNSINTYIVPTAANEVTKPSQPGFLGYLSAQDNNVTGDGTAYLVGSTGNAMTEVFDQNADFNVNGTFTSPVTGRYTLEAGVYLLGYDGTQTDASTDIFTSNGRYRIFQYNPANARTAANETIASGGVLCDMDAADTADLRTSAANGNKVVDGGATARLTYFSGDLTV